MKVLIAEDDIDFGNILSQYVSISGFEVTLSRDGKEAWASFVQEKPDICVLDVMMPEMDGFSLAEKIRQNDPDMPFVFLTAKTLKEDIIKGLKLGADDYITKPFDPEVLILRLNNILKRVYSTINDELTYKIIGCAMKVHNTLGNGFQEVIYQRCLAIEMEKQGLGFMREQEMPIFYEGIEVGTRRVDFLVEDQVMVELKALSQLEDVHLAQGLNYLTAYKLDKGLLINFGAKSLEIKRLFRKNKKNVNPDNLKIR